MTKKKFIGIRVDEKVYHYLTILSKEKGLHHKLSKEIPNINATIELIINEYKKMNNHE